MGNITHLNFNLVFLLYAYFFNAEIIQKHIYCYFAFPWHQREDLSESKQAEGDLDRKSYICICIEWQQVLPIFQNFLHFKKDPRGTGTFGHKISSFQLTRLKLCKIHKNHLWNRGNRCSRQIWVKHALIKRSSLSWPHILCFLFIFPITQQHSRAL